MALAHTLAWWDLYDVRLLHITWYRYLVPRTWYLVPGIS